MNTFKSIKFAAAAALAVGAATLFGAPSQAAEVKLTMVHPFPDYLQYTKNCKAMVAAINERGKGVVQIEMLPLNSIKMFAQAPAVSKGRVDLVCTPAAFYASAIPENEAVSTASSTPAQARAAGGIKILDDLHQKHYNAKYLGWTEGGNNFRIYMKNAPKFGPDGMPDFTGVKMRDNPIYGAFFKAMNATTHNMGAGAVFSALEKGVVDAAAWATLGLKGLKWDKFLRHAIAEEFYQTDIGWLMNLDKWKSLSPAAQKLIQDTVIEFENSNHAMLVKMAAEEKATLIAEGMTFHAVPAGKKFVQTAIESAYARMDKRLTKAKRDKSHVAKLRAAFQQ
jgi:TRAP-type C4-dicarboxylate transport system substrate-binding protein